MLLQSPDYSVDLGRRLRESPNVDDAITMAVPQLNLPICNISYLEGYNNSNPPKVLPRCGTLVISSIISSSLVFLLGGDLWGKLYSCNPLIILMWMVQSAWQCLSWK